MARAKTQVAQEGEGDKVIHNETSWQKAFGTALMFAMAIGTAWGMEAAFGFTWERALIIETLWLVCLTRYHQED
jgi:hypothetical protein